MRYVTSWRISLSQSVSVRRINPASGAVHVLFSQAECDIDLIHVCECYLADADRGRVCMLQDPPGSVAETMDTNTLLNGFIIV